MQVSWWSGGIEVIEAGVVIGQNGEPLFWHLPQNRSGGALPDSRKLWEVLWDNRATLQGFGHSHPGGGMPGPSQEDVTTFAAVEGALGRRLDWWITSSDAVSLLTWSGPSRYAYSIQPVPAPSWVAELRRLSEKEK